MSSFQPIGDATQLWLLLKRVHETVRTAVVSSTSVPDEASEPELSVLVWLYAAEGRAPQSAMAKGLRWDRTRLWHLLARMEQRGYLSRVKSAGVVEVVMLPLGKQVIDASAPALEAASQHHLVDRLGERDAEALRALLTRLLPL